MSKAGLIFSLMACFCFANAQSPAITWSKCYGDTLDNRIWKSITTHDSCIISVGIGDSVRSNNPQIYQVGYINKVDRNGMQLWRKKILYGYNFLYSSILQTQTGELFAGGYPGTNSPFDFLFCKLNSSGDTIFTKYFNNVLISSLLETSKGDILAVGLSIDNSIDLCVMLLTKTGILKWTKHFGGNREDEGYSAIELSDGSFTIYGETYSNNGDVAGFHSSSNLSSDAWFLNIDSTGNKKWQKCIGGTANEVCVDLIHNSDHTYWGLLRTNSFDGDVVSNHGVPDSAWANNPSDVMIVKLDSVGNILKKKCFGGSRYDWAASFLKDSDSNLVILSQTNRATDGDHAGFIIDTVKSYAWLIKVDTSLNISWNKHFGGTNQVNNMHINDLLRLPTGDFIVSGSVSSNGDDITDWHSGYNCNMFGCSPWPDYWLVNLKYQDVQPLKFLSFNAKLQVPKNSALLSWQTANEENVSHFNIQRSFDGSSFTNINKITATNRIANYYTYYDSPGEKGVLFYRLEATDRDGNKTYSTIQKLRFDNVERMLSVFPNPATNTINVTFPKLKQVTIADASGRTVLRQEFGGANNRVQLNISRLPKGLYILNAISLNNSIQAQELSIR